VAVADPARGACHDGLTPDGVNANQGAESTLMWLTAVERMRALGKLQAAPEAVPASSAPLCHDRARRRSGPVAARASW
ncbi:MAG: hypothetical protein ACLQHS_17445, partial [Candidatus Limnocylindrales bacterium]